jgi:hypothetical protein
MAAASRRTHVRVDRDGVKITETAGVRPSIWLSAILIGAIAIALLALRPTRQTDAPEEIGSNGSAVPAAAVDPPRRAQPPKFRPIRRAEPREEPARAPVEAGRESAQPAAENPGDTAAALDAEAPAGIAVFPPPGTDPIKRGLIVPDDFELPPGYVRHYQATDDGQRLPAILMFHPDYDWVDADGNPLDVPADHIVPAELAPAGLPLQTLDVPDIVVPMVEEPGDDQHNH